MGWEDGIPDLEHAMKYLCLAYEAEEPFNAMSRSEWDALREKPWPMSKRYSKAVTLSSRMPCKAPGRRRPCGFARQLSVTDGRFAETKEQLGGFFLINARDMNEAIQVGSKWALARLGNIESVWSRSGQRGAALQLITIGGEFRCVPYA